MNPQPEAITINTFTIIFVLLIIYFALNKKYSYQINDKIELGYIYDSDDHSNHLTQYANICISKPTMHKPIVNKTKKATKINTIKPAQAVTPSKKVNKRGYNALQQDCYDALRSLGMKAKEAEFVVNHTFNNHNLTTIQDFLKIALIR